MFDTAGAVGLESASGVAPSGRLLFCPRPGAFGGRAGVAQLVERNLAKVEVAGSNPVARSEGPVAGPDPVAGHDRGAVAQLARALRSHRRSRGFESLPPHPLFQLQRDRRSIQPDDPTRPVCNLRAPGSCPTGATPSTTRRSLHDASPRLRLHPFDGLRARARRRRLLGRRGRCRVGRRPRHRRRHDRRPHDRGEHLGIVPRPHAGGLDRRPRGGGRLHVRERRGDRGHLRRTGVRTRPTDSPGAPLRPGRHPHPRCRPFRRRTGRVQAARRRHGVHARRPSGAARSGNGQDPRVLGGRGARPRRPVAVRRRVQHVEQLLLGRVRQPLHADDPQPGRPGVGDRLGARADPIRARPLRPGFPRDAHVRLRPVDRLGGDRGEQQLDGRPIRSGCRDGVQPPRVLGRRAEHRLPDRPPSHRRPPGSVSSGSGIRYRSTPRTPRPRSAAYARTSASSSRAGAGTDRVFRTTSPHSRACW